MATWDSDLYLKFEKQRTQPAIDLISRLGAYRPDSILDLGCGPGNSTAALSAAFPNARITGADNSQNMIDKARIEHPTLEFRLCDAHDISFGYDMIFSNACLQWIPDHAELLPELIGKLNVGGVLAVQIPCNDEEPLFRIASDVINNPKWQFQKRSSEKNGVLPSDEYINILSDCATSFDIWETVYYHDLPSHQSLVDWIKGTKLRPYLDVLSAEAAVLFEKEILENTEAAYPIMKNNTVILRFRRMFFIAKN